MPKGGNKMDTKSDEQFLAIEATIEANTQEADRNQVKNDEKLTKFTEYIQKLTIFMMDQANISISSPAQKDTSTLPDTTTTVQTNKRDPPLEGRISEKFVAYGPSNMRSAHQNSISSASRQNSKETLLWILIFLNHIKMSLNAVTRLREDLLPDYQSTKRNSQFEEYFVPDRNHASYSWNVQVYTSLWHPLLLTMTNDTCVKFSMAPQAYKVVRTHAHEMSGWTILSRLLH